MVRNCSVCGRDFQGRADALTCSDACRARRHRGVKLGERVETGLVDALRLELETAGRLDGTLGQVALYLAQRMVNAETSGACAALSKAFAAARLAALADAEDPADELALLRRRLDAKRAASSG
jgi:hypothetical protein